MGKDYGWISVVANQGYHVEPNVGWQSASLKMGPAEREETYRAEQIEALCALRQKRERGNFKGY